jgi:drug/metabolite transporter (DMT)-like permease
VRLVLLVVTTLVAFAANSLLCRAALSSPGTAPEAFTLVRLASGAVALGLLVRLRGGPRPAPEPGRIARGVSLWAYAALFSWAYVRIPAGVGALVLFGCVQATMVGWALSRGEGPRGVQWIGIALALGGLVALARPGGDAPDAVGLLLMAGAGVAWGVYSLLGRSSAAPVATTADAFLAATPLALVAAGIALWGRGPEIDGRGALLAAASGALASAGGYALWYAALPRLGATRAAVVQLAVPLLAAGGGVVLLGEIATLRLALSGAAILGGVALAIAPRSRS